MSSDGSAEPMLRPTWSLGLGGSGVHWLSCEYTLAFGELPGALRSIWSFVQGVTVDLKVQVNVATVRCRNEKQVLPKDPGLGVTN